MNEDFGGRNSDSIRIPASFKSLYGKSDLVFVLAKQNQFGEPTNGIVRRVNDIAFNGFNTDNAKLSSLGGSDAWDPSRFLNLWVVNLSNSGVLGISVFPGDPRPINMHGFVCDYRAFGRGGSYLFPGFNLGRTTTHELGHFYNLRHIWGLEEGCDDTDFPDAPAGQDDTPNQDKDSFGNPDPSGSGTAVFDGCTATGNGIMYQNYMDYTDDKALVMFTKGQFQRMETALTLSPDRAPILTSITYRPAVVYNRDARITRLINPTPSSSQCALFTPSLILRNSGALPLTSVQIISSLNNGTQVVYNWTGNLAAYSETTIALPQMTGVIGPNTLVISTANPNGAEDENVANDKASVSFVVSPTIPLTTRVEENFSTNVFPPKDWNITNPDNDLTWERNPDIGKKWKGSAWVNDWNNPTNFTHDDLSMPRYSFSNIDSAFLTFNMATAIYSDPTSGVPIDTLTILLTKDCGNSFSTIYKKWGTALQTVNFRPDDEFFPASQSQWRLDSVNLTQWLGTTEQQFQVVFRFSGNFENNIFIDDVALYTKTLPAQLKEKGYLILPTVTQNRFSVWHYQQPTTLRYVTVHTSTGQLVWQKEL